MRTAASLVVALLVSVPVCLVLAVLCVVPAGAGQHDPAPNNPEILGRTLYDYHGRPVAIVTDVVWREVEPDARGPKPVDGKRPRREMRAVLTAEVIVPARLVW